MIIGCSRVGVYRHHLIAAVGLTRIGVTPRLRDDRGRWISAHAVIESIVRVDDEIHAVSAPRSLVAHLARAVFGLAVAVITTFRVARDRIADVLRAIDYAWSYLTTPRKAWAVYGYRGIGT